MDVQFISTKLPVITKQSLSLLKKHLVETQKKLDRAWNMIDVEENYDKLDKLTKDVDRELLLIRKTIMYQLKPKRNVTEFDKWFKEVTYKSIREEVLIRPESEIEVKPSKFVPRSPIKQPAIEKFFKSELMEAPGEILEYPLIVETVDSGIDVTEMDTEPAISIDISTPSTQPLFQIAPPRKDPIIPKKDILRIHDRQITKVKSTNSTEKLLKPKMSIILKSTISGTCIVRNKGIVLKRCDSKTKTSNRRLTVFKSFMKLPSHWLKLNSLG